MNERIEKLIEQATETSTSYFDGRGNITETYFDKEKFAELIIQECIKQARSEEDRFYGIGASDLALTMEHFQEVLKTYFGVEE